MKSIPTNVGAPPRQLISLNAAWSVSFTLHICSTSQQGCSHQAWMQTKRPTQWQQEQWLNSLGKCLPLMHGNLRWISTWKRPAAALHSQEVLYCMCIILQRIKRLSACWLLLASVWNFFIYLLCFLCTWLVLLVKVSAWSHKGEFSGKEPISGFLHTADLERRVVQRHHRGYKAKSQVIFQLIFELQLPSIQAIPCEPELSRNWSPLY